jgi:kynureninase
VTAAITGAKPEEVCVMGTLTANLHLMMSQFYKPTSERYKLLCEARAFPSDQVGSHLRQRMKVHVHGQTLTPSPQYAFASQVESHGFDPKDTIIEIAPREGEFWLREEDILDVIEKEGSKIALVLFGGLSYYTGQWFPMKSVTKAAKAKVRLQIPENPDYQINHMPPGMHLWVGPGPRGRQRAAFVT